MPAIELPGLLNWCFSTKALEIKYCQPLHVDIVGGEDKQRTGHAMQIYNCLNCPRQL